MNLLIFGENGQLASELKENCPENIFPTFVGRTKHDLVNEDGIKNIFELSQPDAVINAAAFTDVDKSELNFNLARKINSNAPMLIAQQAKFFDIPFLHVSSDYIFNAVDADPIKESTIPKPVSAYGRSKLEGEQNIIALNCRHIILRTSWVFSKYGKNFVNTILDLAQLRDEINVVDDQFGGPTPASEIAKTCFKILLAYKKDTFKSQILHFSGFPDVSWAEFAKEIILQSKFSTKVNDISTKKYSDLNENYIAERPSNSRFNCNLISHLYSINRPDWRHHLEGIINSKESE